jgi:chemotaxis response regulator CheB
MMESQANATVISDPPTICAIGHPQADQGTARFLWRDRMDTFFRSVAAARGDGLAVVLSGSGSDGAIGVRAMKEAGSVIRVSATRRQQS